MNYLGGKIRIAKEILPIILADRKEGQYFVEPFCGGCNVIDKYDLDFMGWVCGFLHGEILWGLLRHNLE